MSDSHCAGEDTKNANAVPNAVDAQCAGEGIKCGVARGAGDITRLFPAIPRFELVFNGKYQYVIELLMPPIERDIAIAPSGNHEFTVAAFHSTPNQWVVREHFDRPAQMPNSLAGGSWIGLRNKFKDSLQISQTSLAYADGGHFFARGFLVFLFWILASR